MPPSAREHAPVEIRPLRETDLGAASLVMRRAFGTFLGAADPDRFMADRDHVRSRWQAAPAASVAALVGDELVGSNLVTRWGSVGFFGPLTVTPERWDQGVATRLLEPTLALFETWGTDHAGLFTFPHSPKHVELYQKFGFWPRALTAVMSYRVPKTDDGTMPVTLFSELSETDRDLAVEDCRAVTDAIHAGLDVEREIRAVAAQGLGDTVLVLDGDQLLAFGVCHCGAGTEAGASGCYVKFGAARPGPGVAERFARLLVGCIALARSRMMTRVDAGISLAREEAFRAMRSAGFRTQIQGVCMHRPNEPGYHRPGAWVIDDWR